MRVSAVENAPLPFGREGNVYDYPEDTVHSYMKSLLSLNPTTIFGVKSGEDEENDQ